MTASHLDPIRAAQACSVLACFPPESCVIERRTIYAALSFLGQSSSLRHETVTKTCILGMMALQRWSLANFDLGWKVSLSADPDCYPGLPILA